MSQPTSYNRLTSFTNYQAANPTAALQGSSVDLEFNAVKATLDAVLANLAVIQNDDTTVKNASIGVNQMSASVALGFNPVKTWVTGTAFTASPASTVFNGSSIYICLVSHTGGVFATDLAAGKWQLILNLAAIPITAASQVSVVASGILTTDAQTSLQALDTGKAATSHTHVSTAISDSSAIGRTILTAADVATIVAALGLTSSFTTGDVKLTIKTAADVGWIMMNDGTIGDAFSGATFADASAQALFTALYAFADTWAPVSTGRGANAAADWAAHKTIGTLKVLGRALAISGSGSGLTARVLGQTLGEETHGLSIAELPTVTPAGSVAVTIAQTNVYQGGNPAGAAGAAGNFPTTIAGLTASATFTGTPFGSNTAHNNMQPTSFLNAMIKL